MSRGLVALSASAVAAVYMAGYLRTQSADASIGAAVPPSSPPIAAAAPVPTSTPAPRPFIQRQTPAAPTPAPANPPAGSNRAAPTPAPVLTQPQSTALKDGTYAGQGSSRRGDVWVSLQVQGGRIANVNITRSTLQYPLRDIANLPTEVVQRQSAQVDIVSRATYSSLAFRDAVAQALASANAG
jgi:uncharacterized protein with FMN-binding domain